jgi:glycosyltransferase involved in cell wall biosynthesis
MRAGQQEQVASVVRECRERLLEDRTAAPEVATRLLDVEAALLADIRMRRRVRAVTTQKMYAAAQYPPRSLRLPRSYFALKPAIPASKISIVTPSFQQGDYLERTIRSVLAQRYPALEYVVRDGGSRDGSVEILEGFDDQVRWHSAPDDGQADAVNAGFQETTGEIMAFLNADDLLLPGALAYVSRYFAKHPDVDAVYGQRVLIDELDRDIGVWITPGHRDYVLSYGDFMPSETLYWRRSAWEAAGGFIDESFQFALDWDLLMRMRDAGAKIVRVPRMLGAFRVHAEQKTHKIHEICERESALLRERAAGHPVDGQLAYEQVRPYLRAHIVADYAFRARRRLPHRTKRVMPFVMAGGS